MVRRREFLYWPWFPKANGYGYDLAAFSACPDDVMKFLHSRLVHEVGVSGVGQLNQVLEVHVL